ncbi:MAG: Glutamine--fructose-6-phosphate aminotransferase [isomerizing] [Verrucomicrobia subdivision 3 bacterium]|nr:Glutamine--fructose-6-phosphate aminotransferase [isomerizing] [Limisphaerales bacterium]MCS1416234.1 Glutamine--fructose-6-phosphate aminotransferase [isomerizing] [Limisphaerales bacterium]
MKHGPSTLIDSNALNMVLATDGSLYEKVISNQEAVQSRKSPVSATDGDTQIEKKSADVIFAPSTHELICLLLSAIPLQLLAYYIAAERGCDVGKPKNLAKSVTVE